MGLADILSTSTLICLGIMLLLVGVLAMFFMQKMNEQNHKIASMLGLVSTMAEELNFVRSRVQILSANAFPQSGGITMSSSTIAQPDNSLIEVSDNDEDDEDDDDDEEGSESSEDEEDGEEEEDGEDGEDEEDEEDKQNIKTINMGETLDVNIQCEALIEEQDDDDDDDDASSKSELEDELESLNDDDLDGIENDNELMTTESITLTNADYIKSIDISNLEESHADPETFDYKKMSLNKLRNIVVKKGLVKDSSKLKKNELLKMLNAE
jgi:uncharacterized membrane protein